MDNLIIFIYSFKQKVCVFYVKNGYIPWESTVEVVHSALCDLLYKNSCKPCESKEKEAHKEFVYYWVVVV